MTLVIYTAIFGPIRDQLQPPRNIPEDVLLHAYVDNVTEPTKHSSGWEMRPAVWLHPTNPRLRSRRHKLLSHQLYPDADVTLWLDGCLTPVANPHKLVEQHLGTHDLCLFKHMQRNCLYQEAEACVRLKKDRPEVLRALVNRYKAEGYPYNSGLVETTAVLRRHTDAIISFNEEWWHELKNNSIRDQMSFNYVAWRRGIKYAAFPGNRVRSPHFQWRPHR